MKLFASLSILFFTVIYKTNQTCAFCEKSSCTSGNCVQCETGYFPDVNKDCRICSSECEISQCDEVKGCTKCKEGYRPNKGDCKECDFLCENCDQSQGCLKCKSGFYPNSEAYCQQCDQNCVNCDQENGCIRCKSGYFLKDKACLICPDNCEDGCDGVNGCSKCSEDFYIGNQGLGCLQCPENCISGYCLFDSGCKRCKPGYYLSPDGTKCLSCGENCNLVYCYNKRGCTGCNKGWGLLEGKCVKPCNENCLTCSSSSDSVQNVCKECKSNFWINEYQVCESCGEFCKNCTMNEGCVECDRSQGHFLHEGRCYECSDIYECLSCKFAVGCSECTLGYFADSGGCKKGNLTSIAAEKTGTEQVQGCKKYFFFN